MTGRKGKGSKIHYIRDKSPTQEDWIKILSKVKEVGKIFKEKRLEMSLSQKKIS